MTSSLAKYHARSPRYILQPQDNTLIRVAGPQNIPWEECTEIKNISLTGLVFTAPSDLCPSIGEFIKIEYAVPGSQKMAAHALVIRLEERSPSSTLVGVKFFRMDLAQRVILAQGLALRLREQQAKRMEERRKKLGRAGRYLPLIFLLFWSVLFYFSSSWQWLQYLSNSSK